MQSNCSYPDLAPLTAYKVHKCRCIRCLEWYHTVGGPKDRERVKKWKSENREKARENSIRFYYKYHEKNRERSRKRSKEQRLTNPEYARNYSLKTKFGLSSNEFSKMSESQHGLCLICGNPPKRFKNLSVDHDHKTGEIRGLLCLVCNLVLGHAKDDINYLTKCINYLNTHAK